MHSVGCVPTAGLAYLRKVGCVLPPFGPPFHVDRPPPQAKPPSKGRHSCEQMTDACENITFPHNSYAVGKEGDDMVIQLLSWAC